MRAVWMVEEDNRGRWREFPDHLAALVENRYQEWLDQPWEDHSWYTYEWTMQGQTVHYEIAFHRPMSQAKRAKFNECAVCTMEQVQLGE